MVILIGVGVIFIESLFSPRVEQNKQTGRYLLFYQGFDGKREYIELL